MNSLALNSTVSLRSIRKEVLIPSVVPARTLSLKEVLYYGFPHLKMDTRMRKWKIRNLPNLMRGAWKIQTAKHIGIPHLYGQLCLAAIAPDGTRRDYGLVSLRMITSSGASYVVDAFQGLQALSNMRYHGLGGTSTPETAGDSALGSEFASAYVPVSTRAQGTLGEGIGPTFYRTIAFITFSDSVTVAEHGIFNQAATGGGTLLDRSVVASETFFANFTIQSDYRLEIATGT